MEFYVFVWDFPKPGNQKKDKINLTYNDSSVTKISKISNWFWDFSVFSFLFNSIYTSVDKVLETVLYFPKSR